MKTFAGKRILLLQGPVGPFFSRLAGDLRRAGAEVCKINFNGGDWLFCPKGQASFRGTLADWPGFLDRMITERSADLVFLFGDCRPIHGIAREVARRRGVTVCVFEEGYIRPDYITLEEYGVNGYSPLPSSPEDYLSAPVSNEKPTMPVGNTFWHMAAWDILYYLAGALGAPVFRRYTHHRPLSLTEALPWVAALWRKCRYAVTERGVQGRLAASLSGRYFLVPLQVHTDGQIRVHSAFGSVAEFIRHTVYSFAAHAPADTFLVLKHHPLDRGYNDYTALIRGLSRELGLGGRVIYVHDPHLPTLLHHARGVVVINSTVGLSAIHHGTPVKACGSAIYDMEGLTFQGSLDDFWKAARSAEPDRWLYIRFRNYVIEHSQLNGNYYKRLKGTSLCTGIDWHNVRSIINRNEGGQVEGTHNGGRTGDQVLAAVSRALP